MPGTGTRGATIAPLELLDAIRRKGRSIVFATAGSEESRLLKYFGANANAGGPQATHLILLPDARKVEALEEFLHGTQQKIGFINREGVPAAEVHVKRFMIRHARLLGLNKQDVDALQQMLDSYL